MCVSIFGYIWYAGACLYKIISPNVPKTTKNIHNWFAQSVQLFRDVLSTNSIVDSIGSLFVKSLLGQSTGTIIVNIVISSYFNFPQHGFLWIPTRKRQLLSPWDRLGIAGNHYRNASQIVGIEQWKEGWPHDTHELLNC